MTTRLEEHFAEEHCLESIGITDPAECRIVWLPRRGRLGRMSRKQYEALCDGVGFLHTLTDGRMADLLSQAACAIGGFCTDATRQDGHYAVESFLACCVGPNGSSVLGYAAAMALYGTETATLTISRIFVLPAARRYGFGSRMVAACHSKMAGSRHFRRWLQLRGESARVASAMILPVKDECFAFAVKCGYGVLPVTSNDAGRTVFLAVKGGTYSEIIESRRR